MSRSYGGSYAGSGCGIYSRQQAVRQLMFQVRGQCCSQRPTSPKPAAAVADYPGAAGAAPRPTPSVGQSFVLQNSLAPGISLAQHAQEAEGRKTIARQLLFQSRHDSPVSETTNRTLSSAGELHFVPPPFAELCDSHTDHTVPLLPALQQSHEETPWHNPPHQDGTEQQLPPSAWQVPDSSVLWHHTQQNTSSFRSLPPPPLPPHLHPANSLAETRRHRAAPSADHVEPLPPPVLTSLLQRATSLTRLAELGAQHYSSMDATHLVTLAYTAAQLVKAAEPQHSKALLAHEHNPQQLHTDNETITSITNAILASLLQHVSALSLDQLLCMLWAIAQLSTAAGGTAIPVFAPNHQQTLRALYSSLKQKLQQETVADMPHAWLCMGIWGLTTIGCRDAPQAQRADLRLWDAILGRAASQAKHLSAWDLSQVLRAAARQGYDNTLVLHRLVSCIPTALRGSSSPSTGPLASHANQQAVSSRAHSAAVPIVAAGSNGLEVCRPGQPTSHTAEAGSVPVYVPERLTVSPGTSPGSNGSLLTSHEQPQTSSLHAYAMSGVQALLPAPYRTIQSSAEHAYSTSEQGQSSTVCPQDVAQLLWSLAALGYRDNRALGTLAHKAGQLAHLMTPVDAALALWGLTTFRAIEGPHYRPLLAACTRLAQHMPPYCLVMCAWSLASAPGRAVQGLQELPALAEAVWSQLDACLGSIQPQELAILCWSAASSRELVKDAQVVWKLPAAACEVSEQLSPLGVAMVAWAAAKIGIYDETVFARLCNAAQAHIHEFPPQPLSMFLWALATAGHKPAPQLLQAAALSAHSVLKQFKPQEVANILWALATLGWYSEGLFAAVADAMTQQPRSKQPTATANHAASATNSATNRRSTKSSKHPAPQPTKRGGRSRRQAKLQERPAIWRLRSLELAKLVGAFARVGHMDEALYDEAANAVLSKLKSAADSGGQAAQNTHPQSQPGLATYSANPSRPVFAGMLEHVDHRVTHSSEGINSSSEGVSSSKRSITGSSCTVSARSPTRDELQAPSVSMLLWAFAEVGLPWNTTSHKEVIQRLIEQAAVEVPHMQARDAARTLWALAHLDRRQHTLAERLLDHVTQHVRHATPADLVSVMWACAMFRLYDAKVTAAACETLCTNLRQLPFKQLAEAMWSLGELGVYDLALFDHVAKEAVQHLQEAEARDVTGLLSAYANVGHLDEQLLETACLACLQNLDLVADELALLAWSCAVLLSEYHASMPSSDGSTTSAAVDAATSQRSMVGAVASLIDAVSAMLDKEPASNFTPDSLARLAQAQVLCSDWAAQHGRYLGSQFEFKLPDSLRDAAQSAWVDSTRAHWMAVGRMTDMKELRRLISQLGFQVCQPALSLTHDQCVPVTLVVSQRDVRYAFVFVDAKGRCRTDHMRLLAGPRTLVSMFECRGLRPVVLQVEPFSGLTSEDKVCLLSAALL